MRWRPGKVRPAVPGHSGGVNQVGPERVRHGYQCVVIMQRIHGSKSLDRVENRIGLVVPKIVAKPMGAVTLLYVDFRNDVVSVGRAGRVRATIVQAGKGAVNVGGRVEL